MKKVKKVPASLGLAVSAALALAIGAVFPVAAMSTDSTTAQSTNLPTQFCTGYGNQQKCTGLSSKIPVDTINTILAGSNVPTDIQQTIDQRIAELTARFNQGNGLPTDPVGGTGNTGNNGNIGSNGSNGTDGMNGTDGKLPSTLPTNLQNLQSLAQQFLDQQRGASGDNGSNGAKGNGGNKGSIGDTGSNGQQACLKIQDAVNKRIAGLNKNAQEDLARLDDILAKLQDYGKTTDPSRLPPDYQQILDQVLQAQTEATKAVATLATLSINLNCDQTNPALALSTVKTAADTTRAQLTAFKTSLGQLTSGLEANAKN